ncbi:uncharacterized protein LOC121892174 isoform X1 [Thunnus maccoyii]|uniref:uncharacterized protein LOC121892174 isoform X1 n=1 Tax=Thunnus maccoyii TaxID=8240 RepID=UPI001C4B1A03|nr:uncharacterized protein LOC121892174 isoform X1 [Thunnus maccoyii]XP_042260987.1 uncharacterized protein LOC121892174 isoform X1 [Thunnus maccoyii]
MKHLCRTTVIQVVFCCCCFFCHRQAHPFTNVAPSGTASQSSTHDNADAWKAIDGNRNPNYHDGSCTHTEFGLPHWWRLQLPAMYRISSISITNRDIGADRINNAEILIGNSLENNGNNNPRCAVISSIPSSGTSSFHCRGMVGRFVNVYLSGTDPNGVLTLCELEVYGELATLAPTINAVVMGRNIVVVQRKLCWSDALFYCRDFYWDLLSIRSEEEWREMEEVLRIQSPHLTKHVWVGLRRYLMAGTWFWMSGDSMNFTYWEAQSVWQNTSPCGGMDTRNHFYWRDLPCHDHLYFVCLTDFKKYKDRVEFYSSTRP